MKLTDHKVQLYLPQSLYDFLRQAARRQGASLSAYLRQLLSLQVPGGAPGTEDPLLRLTRNRKGVGPRDGSRNVDKYLYGDRSR
ncbi:MAG: hypothetical protein IT452_14470 [Planctomycetia bacterium]|nr:hypothetical protein [Planctomycetia bacterium]